MIQLIEEQSQALTGNREVEVVDPKTSTRYVLVQADLYERLITLLVDDNVYTTAEMLDRIMIDDAHDPYLAELQQKYQDRLK